MKSTRTKYREIRKSIIRTAIYDLTYLMTLHKKDLEKIPIDDFKKLKIMIEEMVGLETGG